MKDLILSVVKDLERDFIYYDRQDFYLSPEILNTALKKGEITIDEIVNEFRKHLENRFNN